MGQRLELHTVVREEREGTDLEIECDFLLLGLNKIDDLIPDELEDSLDEIGSTVAHISNCLETGGD